MKIINRYVFDLESTGSSKHLLEYLSQVPASIISKIAYHKDPKNFPFHPVGSGAFELQDWSVNNFVRLKRFSKNDKLKNINGSSLIQSIRFIWVSHDVSKQLALKSQRVDLIFEVPPRDALQIESLKNSFIKLYSFPSATFNILGFNHLNPLFNDPHLKKTILRIIDRKEITQNLYAHFAAIPSSFSLYKTGSPASAFIVKSITNNSNILKLLREKPLKLITLNDPKRSTMATILQYQFAKKGIKIEITKYSWPAFIKAVEKKDFDLILFAESARFYYPLYFFQLIVDFNKNTDNLLFYKNKSVHLLIQDLLITRNTTKEKALITNILNLLAQDLPFIPLNNPSQIIAYQNNIRGLVFQSDGVIDFTNTSKISFK
jgi:ABC-type transport system substrate-binding protein